MTRLSTPPAAPPAGVFQKAAHVAKVRTPDTEFALEGESRTPAPVMGRRAQRTSALIRDTARQVFLSKGYFGTTIDDIAEAAGVSRSSFYTYFPTKPAWPQT